MNEPINVITSAEPINISNHFKTLYYFRVVCEKDDRLTPAAQLLFRLLVEQANFSQWTDTFTYPIDAIIKVSHLARQTVVDARRLLKNLGYIDYKGNPSRYTVKSLVDCELDRSDTPRPPVKNIQTKTKEKNEQKRKGEPRNDAELHNSRHNRANLSEAAKAEVERCLSKFNRQFGSH